MPITQQFIGTWFAGSAFTFLILREVLYKTNGLLELPRDLNALCILVSQAIGAGLAYAVH